MTVYNLSQIDGFHDKSRDWLIILDRITVSMQPCHVTLPRDWSRMVG